MHCAICGADAWYVCGRSGRPVCPQHSRIEIVSRLSFGSSGGLSVREAQPPDYEKIGHLAAYFDTARIVRFGKEYDILSLPAYVVGTNSHLAGVLAYSIEPESLVIVTLGVIPGYQGLGAGSMLLDATKEKAAAESRKSLLASASNDDLPAIYFYQQNGFRIYDVNPNSIADCQGGLKVGFAGIPCRDELLLHCEI